MNKPAAVLSVLAAALLLALTLLDLLAKSAGCGTLLLAQATKQGSTSLDKIETFCQDEFLVTYELRRPASAATAQISRPVTVAATNSYYRAVLGYPMVSGGFFTATDWSGGQRHAVLNLAAADDLFGGGQIVGNTFKLDGQSWTVVGVMDDGDDDATLYLPATERDGAPAALLALLDTGKVSEEYAKTALKTLGVNESGWDYIPLNRVSAFFAGSVAAAWRTAACLLLALALPRVWRWVTRRLRLYRDDLKRFYPRELFARDRAGALQTALGALLLPAGGAAALYILLALLSFALFCRTLPAPGVLLRLTAFPGKTAPAARLFLLALVAGGAYLSTLAALGVTRARPKEVIVCETDS